MYAEQLLPHDVEAEEAVIGSLLIDGDSFLRISSLIRQGDFYREKNGLCFKSCVELFRRSEAIDQVTLARELSRNNELDSVEPIREPGEYEITLRLSPEIEATIHVMAEAEE